MMPEEARVSASLSLGPGQEATAQDRNLSVVSSRDGLRSGRFRSAADGS